MAAGRQKLGQILVTHGVITSKDVDEALQRQIIFGGRLGTNLMELGIVPEETILKALSHQQKVPYAKPEHFDNIPQGVIQSVPLELVKKHGIVPIAREKTRIILAMTDPARLDIIDEVAFRTGCTVTPVIAGELRIMQALDRYYGIHRDTRFIHVTGGAPREAAPPAPREVKPLYAKDVVPVEEVTPEEEPLSLENASLDLAEARDREQVADTVIRQALLVLDDVVLFILKGDEAQGWREGGKVKVADGIENWTVKVKPQSLLTLLQEGKASYQASGRDAYVANPWLAVISPKPPMEVFAHPIVIKNRAVSALVGFARSRSLRREEVEFLVRLMRKVTLAFEILVLKSKLTTL